MNKPHNIIPLRDPEIVTDTLEGELVLYHPQRTTAIYLNQTASLIWGLCDGHRSLAEIVELLAMHYPDAGSNLETEVREAIESLRQQRAVQ
ncbi:MAG: pyrroloquinoline quinone biosynthesis peptide chaperone PqqD [Xanthobacteraceae bacterium]|jgi:coenzyme PQQ biosynthesis protein PqqD